MPGADAADPAAARSGGNPGRADPLAPAASPGQAAPSRPAPSGAGTELRVTTVELFFDLVFAFTLTQLTVLLGRNLSAAGAVRVLLIFGVLWWMYGGYAWLTNARPPVHAPERLLLLAAMAGFLIAGLAIPGAFGPDGIALGLGYLLVVLVHAYLYLRVNRNILRIAPFNVASALMVIGAGAIASQGGGRAAVPAAVYLLWVLALLVQAGSPLIVHPAGRFAIRAGHAVERHSALVIVALGESVAAVGIGAARLAAEQSGISAAVIAAAVLGLALAVAMWWALFGGDEDRRAEEALASAAEGRRTRLVLGAYFYAFIPLLLGVVAMAAGMQRAVEHAITFAGAGAGDAAVLAAGAALLLGGSAQVIRVLGIGQVRIRVIAAVAALVTLVVGVTAGLTAQLALLTVMMAAMLVAEHRAAGHAATR